MACEFQLLINGVCRDGSDGESVDVINPAAGLSFGKVAYASPADIEEVVHLAERGLRTWSAVPPWERGRILKEAAARLRAGIVRIAEVITRAQGKPLAEAHIEIERSADFLEWGGEQARRIAGRIVPGRRPGQRIEIQPHPIGIVAAFTPWNFSMALAAKKFAGALAAGCPIICKPSQETPGSVLEMARTLIAAGVHPAAVAVIFGDANQVSTQLIESPSVAKITFTGAIPKRPPNCSRRRERRPHASARDPARWVEGKRHRYLSPEGKSARGSSSSRLLLAGVRLEKHAAGLPARQSAAHRSGRESSRGGNERTVGAYVPSGMRAITLISKSKPASQVTPTAVQLG
jgi:hypothetical protein